MAVSGPLIPQPDADVINDIGQLANRSESDLGGGEDEPDPEATEPRDAELRGPAIELGDLAHDSEAEAAARYRLVEPF